MNTLQFPNRDKHKNDTPKISPKQIMDMAQKKKNLMASLASEMDKLIGPGVTVAFTFSDEGADGGHTLFVSKPGDVKFIDVKMAPRPIKQAKPE